MMQIILIIRIIIIILIIIVICYNKYKDPYKGKFLKRRITDGVAYV